MIYKTAVWKTVPPDKIRYILIIRVRFTTEYFSERGLIGLKADASLVSRYCLPDSTSLYGYNPETSSRVTLATLGTVFQTELHHLIKSAFYVNIQIF